MGRLANKVAIVTGGARGIGLAIARRFIAEGAKVIIGDIDEQGGRKAADELGEAACRFARTDVGDAADARNLVAVACRSFTGDLDILVNNAGITSDKTFQKMDHASWRTVLATNLDGVFNCTKVFIDGMLAQGWGRVVNITSVIGQIGNFGQVNYAASKAGVAAFTKSLAKEVAAKGITVNAVAPGFIETEMVHAIPDRIRTRLLEQIPMRRFGKAEEVARACVYLCSTDGDYITGSELMLNGGLYM
jgi:NAD(P)-dependent dehydrogenase (short-subunit alcohol dehydrogenase family)